MCTTDRTKQIRFRRYRFDYFHQGRPKSFAPKPRSRACLKRAFWGFVFVVSITTLWLRFKRVFELDELIVHQFYDWFLVNFGSFCTPSILFWVWSWPQKASTFLSQSWLIGRLSQAFVRGFGILLLARQFCSLNACSAQPRTLAPRDIRFEKKDEWKMNQAILELFSVF